MSKFLLIQSKSPWESGDVGRFYGLARELGNAGGEVTFFLVQNGVTAARTGAKDAAFDQLLGGKVRVLADDLAERGIQMSQVIPGIEQIPRAAIARLIETHDRVLSW
jgi:sulfur relay protein TusB/DsrH